MKLSIIIPCYNCRKTIARLLNSIIQNGWDKEDYEVIVCDDKSTDGFLDVVRTYEEQINFIYCETTRDVHCPGNTRQAALQYVTGEWFTFIDNDDMFEVDAFNKVFNYIEQHQDAYVVATDFREYFVESESYGRVFEGGDAITWLHGKFYNKAKILDEFGTHFEDDLFSHEDVYFNSYIVARLVSMQIDYDYYKIYTYKWVCNPESLSRSYFSKDHFYIETYLADYLHAASYPFFPMLTEDATQYQKEFCIARIMSTLLHGYFYYQAAVWRLGPTGTLDEAYIALKHYKRKMMEELHINDWDIIYYVYNDPKTYDSIKEKCKPGSCHFVELVSFRDFILNL